MIHIISSGIPKHREHMQLDNPLGIPKHIEHHQLGTSLGIPKRMEQMQLDTSEQRQLGTSLHKDFQAYITEETLHLHVLKDSQAYKT